MKKPYYICISTLTLFIMNITCIIESFIIGIIGGLLSFFYRNCLKMKNMIFTNLYNNVLKPASKSDNWFIRNLAYPLGYCIYCNGFWVTFLLYVLYIYMKNPLLNSFNTIGTYILSFIAAIGMQHFIIVICLAIIGDYRPKDMTQLRKELK